MTIAIVRRKTNNSITMEGSTSSINSRATAIKTILLAAWRGKLTNEEWETRIKKVLPRGVNGDVYDLADCLLKQALIGPVPNQLFLNYLKHAVSCELVSHGAVLTSISKQPINLRITSTLMHRTSPIICLLEFLRAFRDKISCKGTELECLNLCHSLCELTHWLLKCLQQIFEFIIANPPANTNLQQSTAVGSTNVSTGIGNTNATVYNNSVAAGQSGQTQTETLISIIDLATEMIHHFISRPFIKSLLFIGKLEYSNEFDENILKLVYQINQRMTSSPQLNFLNDRIQHLNSLQQLSKTFNSRESHPSVVAAQQLRCLQTHRIRSTQIASGSSFERNRIQFNTFSPQSNDSNMNYALFNSLYPLVAFDAILRPARLNRHLARQIVTITNFGPAPVHTTYCELIRVCMIGLIDAHGNSKAKATWSFFTFLKLPRLLIELNRLFDKQKQHQKSLDQTQNQQQQQQTLSANESLESTANFINDLKQAFERLCEYSPLLDEAESKCNCDLFKCLIKELTKNDPNLIQLRNLEFKNFPARRPVNTNTNNNVKGGQMMLRAEPVVSHMLDTLISEQDSVELFSVLRQSCSGISFEYTLSAAAATGRLHLFVKRLIEHNELYKLPRDNLPPKNAQALNFDITFLILIYIAQRYGSELIEKDSSTTFNKWYYECYNQDTCSNCPKEMLKNCNDSIVSNLIKQLVYPNQNIQLKSVNWNDVCFNTPKAISEILFAWNQGQLNDEDIALVIERLRSKMCFMAVMAANWLQCYIKTLDESEKAKPLFMLNNLSKPSQLAKQQNVTNQLNSDGQSSELENWGYAERSSLMGAIIKRIYFVLVPNKSQMQSNGVASSGSAAAAIKQTHLGNALIECDDSHDETSYHSYKDRFISTLTTKDIFLANVKRCLDRGWIDYDSLNSISSLFKIIGSQCFTDLIVREILTSHESPSDLSRAVNITFGLFHLDIEACTFALLDNIIPNWLMSEKDQVLLNQPRAFALANLAVMTIIEVYNNLMAAQTSLIDCENISLNNQTNEFSNNDRKQFSMNGIKQEPFIQNSTSTTATPMSVDSINENATTTSVSNGPRDNVKRIKLMQQQLQQQDSTNSLNGLAGGFGDTTNSVNLIATGGNSRTNGHISDCLDKLNGYIANLMRLFKEIMSDSVISHRTLFPILFLQQTVVCARESSNMITVHLQPEILLDIIDLFSSELTFELVVAISNLSTTHSRKYTAKSVCKLVQLVNGTSDGQFGYGSMFGLAAAAAAAASAATTTTAVSGGVGGSGGASGISIISGGPGGVSANASPLVPMELSNQQASSVQPQTAS